MAKAKEKSTAPAAASPAPKKSGFPVIIIIVGILCILCAGATVLGVFLINRAKRNANDTLQDGFQNLLENGFENAVEDKIKDETGEDTDFSLDGELPDDFPSDVSVYPDAEIGYSSSSTESGKTTVWVNFTTTDTSKEVSDFYEEELPNDGWEVTNTTQFLGYTVVAEKDGRSISVFATDSEDGGSYITMTITEE